MVKPTAGTLPDGANSFEERNGPRAKWMHRLTVVAPGIASAAGGAAWYLAGGNVGQALLAGLVTGWLYAVATTLNGVLRVMQGQHAVNLHMAASTANLQKRLNKMELRATLATRGANLSDKGVPYG